MLLAVLILGTAILGVAGVFAQLSIGENTIALWQRLPLWVSFTIMGLALALLIWGLMWGWNLAPGSTL